jgi:hypothetical protein
MKTLTGVAMNYVQNNNPDPSNFYDGEIQRDVYRVFSVIDAVLCLTSGSAFRIVLRNITEILTLYLNDKNN